MNRTRAGLTRHNCNCNRHTKTLPYGAVSKKKGWCDCDMHLCGKVDKGAKRQRDKTETKKELKDFLEIL